MIFRIIMSIELITIWCGILPTVGHWLSTCAKLQMAKTFSHDIFIFPMLKNVHCRLYLFHKWENEASLHLRSLNLLKAKLHFLAVFFAFNNNISLQNEWRECNDFTPILCRHFTRQFPETYYFHLSVFTLSTKIRQCHPLLKI